MPVQNGAPPILGAEVTVAAMEAAPIGSQVASPERIYTKEADGRWSLFGAVGRYRARQFGNGVSAPGYVWVKHEGAQSPLGTTPTVTLMKQAPVGARIYNTRSGNTYIKHRNGSWANEANGAEHSSRSFEARLGSYTWLTWPDPDTTLAALPQVRVTAVGALPYPDDWPDPVFPHLVTGNVLDEDTHYRLLLPATARRANDFTGLDRYARQHVADHMHGMDLRQWWVPKHTAEEIVVPPAKGAPVVLNDAIRAPAGARIKHTEIDRVWTKQAGGLWSSPHRESRGPEALALHRYVWAHWPEETESEPRPYLASTLWLISMEKDYSIYETPDGTEVWLRHDTGKEVTEFARLDFAAEWKKWKAIHGTYDSMGFLRELKEKVVDPEAVDANITTCAQCAVPHVRPDLREVEGGHLVCPPCATRFYRACARCGTLSTTLHTTQDQGDVCRPCINEHFTKCRQCGVWLEHDVFEEHRREHDGSGCCRSPMEEFTIPNDGNDPLPQDTRVTIHMGAGTLTPEGQQEIRSGIIRWLKRGDHSLGYYADRLTDAWKVYESSSYLAELGDKWQTKEGNYPKRFSKLVYKRHGVKVPADLISEIGNIGALHTAGSDFHVEVTRHLDGPPVEYGQAGSCWWQSYWHCRCMLKSNGGFGLRTWSSLDSKDVAVGRAWVIPLRSTDEGLRATFDAQSPDAYIVFNAYGNLVQYTAPRILAHMAGMTYKKINLDIQCVEKRMYLNADSGYLVAPEDVAQAYDQLSLTLNQHADLFGTEKKEKVA